MKNKTILGSCFSKIAPYTVAILLGTTGLSLGSECYEYKVSCPNHVNVPGLKVSNGTLFQTNGEESSKAVFEGDVAKVGGAEVYRFYCAGRNADKLTVEFAKKGKIPKGVKIESDGLIAFKSTGILENYGSIASDKGVELKIEGVATPAPANLGFTFSGTITYNGVTYSDGKQGGKFVNYGSFNVPSGDLVFTGSLENNSSGKMKLWKASVNSVKNQGNFTAGVLTTKVSSSNSGVMLVQDISSNSSFDNYGSLICKNLSAQHTSNNNGKLVALNGINIQSSKLRNKIV